MKKIYKVVIMQDCTDDKCVWVQFIECDRYQDIVDYIATSDCKIVYHENVTDEHITNGIDKLINGEMIYAD